MTAREWTRIGRTPVSYATTSSNRIGLTFRRDDDSGEAVFGVREPRRPLRPNLSGSAALPLPVSDQFAIVPWKAA